MAQAISIIDVILAKALAISASKAYTDQKTQSLMCGVHYRGQVDYYDDLPNDPEEGDSYTVKYAGSSGTVADGTEYTWGIDSSTNTMTWISFSKDAYSKAETDLLLAAKANSADVYTKAEVDELLEDIDVPTALSELTDDSTHRLVTDAQKTEWSGKQNAISDLTAIRSGAALGATAVQPETGKGLSSNDYTTAEKTKLDSLAEIKTIGTGLNLDDNGELMATGGGTGGTTNYNDLSNKPQINGNTLSGNKTSAQLGLADASDIPTTLAELTDDATHRTVTDTEKATWNAKADAADIPTVPVKGVAKNGTTITPDASGVVNITVPTTAGLQTELSSTNKLNPAYINYDSTHAAVTEAEKASYAGKQNAIDRLHKLASDLVDDTSSTNKFATQAQLSQIETNENNISLIKNDYNMLGELSKIEYTEKSEGACSYYGQKLNLQKNIYVPEYYMDFTISSSSSIQGGAIYGNYYVQFTDKMNSFTIIDLINKNVVQDTTLSPVATYHCNNANFSNIFYNESDIFPLLYISQENESEHKVLVYRLIGEIGGITLQLIQTITFDAPDICGVYYPNACVDNDNGLLIQIGYSENSYVKSSTNELVFNVFELPDISNSEVALSDNAKVDTFRLPSLSATQGAFILNGNIYHLFGGGNTERWIKVINIASHQTITSINLNAQTTLYGRTIIAGEQETIFTFDGELYSVGLDKKIYKIATNESNYIPAKKVLSLPKMLNGYSVVADTNGGLICHQVPPIRGTITIKKNDVNKIFALPIGEYTRIGNYKNVDAAAVEIMRTHGLIAIPEGAKSVKLTMTNTSYYYGLVIINRRKDDKTQGNRTYDSGWTLGGNDIIYDLSSLNYNYYEYGIASTFKIGVAGTTNFTDETIESLGWSYEFSF